MEKTYLVGVHIKQPQSPAQHARQSIEELERLVETAGGTVVGTSLQAMTEFNPATLIGKGKVEELKAMAQRKEFGTLVFDEELKPAQHKNLSEMIPAKILDRTRVILDIFAKRARSREGILQVELAQLAYSMPRITERYGRFEQQVGGIGTRGPGERKLEVEARHIRDRIAHLKKEIDSIRQQRALARERRHSVPIPIITLVGYTNAGKSTLLNSLVEFSGEHQEPTYADDKLFATLDPTTRRVRLPSGRWVLFTDTVGFIRKLPTHLIAAFRSTLEETLDADILVHLMDAADPNRTLQYETVLEILGTLEKKGQSFREKMLLVYNKLDLLSTADQKLLLEKIDPAFAESGLGDPMGISAGSGKGLPVLLQAIEKKLSGQLTETKILVPYNRMDLMPSLHRLGQVLESRHLSRGVQLRLNISPSHLEKIEKLLKG